MAHTFRQLRLGFSLPLALIAFACGGGQSFDDGSDRLGTTNDQEGTDGESPAPGGPMPGPTDSSDPTSSSDPPSEFLSVSRLDFQLESAEGFSPSAGSTVVLWFQREAFGFSAGCNSFRGTYTLCDGAMCGGDVNESTLLPCAADKEAQDTFLATFFSSTPSVSLEGDRLTLANDTTTLEFLNREAANPDRSLTGRVWVIDTFITAEAASNFPFMVPPTLEFGDDGSFVAFTTCIEAYGTFTLTGQTLELAGLSYNEPPCPETGSEVADSHIKELLSDTVQLEIDGTRLTLTRGDLGLSARTE